MKPLRKAMRWTVVEIATLALLHFILLRWLADRNIVAVIFSMGKHTPPSYLAIAGGFLVLRFALIFLLPGLIAARIGKALFSLIDRNEPPSPSSSPSLDQP